nr:hypothetical protein [Tanacetum cinerariifolium]
MAVIRNNLGWKVKDFRGMTFKEVETKFNSVWKQMEDFIPMGSKEEAERIKRKGLSLEQESGKKQKTSDWKVHTEGHRSYWRITRIETMEEGTKILAIVDGIHRTVTESSLRRDLKLQDEDGINSLHDTEIFENLTLMGYKISPNQKFTFQKGTPTEPHHTPSPEAQPSSHTTHSSSTFPPVTITSIPIVTLSETTPIRQYTRRARIVQSFALLTVADEPESPLRDEMETLLTSMDAATVLARGAAEVPTGSGSIPIVGPPAVEVPTGSGSIPTAGPFFVEVPTGSDVVPTASPVFATATLVTPYRRRRKGKEVMVEFDTLKKQKVQEQINAQVARELEEQL